MIVLSRCRTCYKLFTGEFLYHIYRSHLVGADDDAEYIPAGARKLRAEG